MLLVLMAFYSLVISELNYFLSYMIKFVGDGVCDDDINVDSCAFDGGDCCLQKKITSLCRSCLCQITTDPMSLRTAFKQNHVSILHLSTKFDFLHWEEQRHYDYMVDSSF